MCNGVLNILPGVGHNNQHIHVNSKNGTNHEETSCGMDRTISTLDTFVK